ncbi:chromate transporter [Klebsiella pneumoniae subsp. pneumoniae]|nr:chromate transporter [Klebsiella pneumoniae subsp. pneumoniae]
MSKTVVLPQSDSPSVVASVSFWQAFRFWLKLGFISFGGPAGQIAMMHQELVDNRRWISEGRFLHALNFCMVLPGPEAQQLATYIGWLMHKTWGGVIAGVLFILPSLVLLIALAWIYLVWGGCRRGGGDLLWHQTRRSGDSIAGGAPHRLAGAEKWRLLDHRRRCLCRYFCAERSFSADRPRRGTGGFYRRTAGADDIRQSGRPPCAESPWRSRHH